MSRKFKRFCLGVADLALAVYLVMCFSAFNKPEKKINVCKQVNIAVADEKTDGFINAQEVKNRLVQSNLFPIGKNLEDVNCRNIEDMLLRTPFVKTADCYKNQQGELFVKITQRLPLVRIKTSRNEDYYIDDNYCVMPNSQYTSDMLIATGSFSKSYAMAYIAPLAKILDENETYSNLFEQINITHDYGVELIPRLGNHVVYLGHLPRVKFKSDSERIMRSFLLPKLKRLALFYKYGLSEAGWDKYSEISLEFDNQIVCKKKDNSEEN